jgi:hypothetical protein
MSAMARGRALTVLAVVLALLAVSDVLKPLRLEGAETGLVFLGRRLTGTAGGIAGLALGTYLAIYAAGVWGMRRWARPMAWGYAAYVTLNLVLFPFRTPQPPDAGVGYLLFGIVYTLLAIGGAVGCAVLLGRRAAALR